MRNIWKDLDLYTRARRILSTCGEFIFRIVRGWWLYSKGENKELMHSRLSVCELCELRKWIVCGQCGCHLKAKASDPEEKCPHPSFNQWIYIDSFYKNHPLKTETFETRSDI